MAFKILTANRLKDGLSVWYGNDDLWHEEFDKSFIAKDDESLAFLQKALENVPLLNEVVDVNLIDIDIKNDQIIPKRLRERIRQKGPSIAYGEVSPITAEYAAKKLGV